MGVRTYQKAPPIPDFIDAGGAFVVPRELILTGQEIFLRKNLMDYGSMFGDGANRGPNFSADALHQAALEMAAFHRAHATGPELALEAVIADRVRREIKENRHDPATCRTVLTSAQVHGFRKLVERYGEMFAGRGPEAFHPAG